jgi:hypothetical protein
MNRHRFDPVSFVFGLIFVATGVAFMIDDVRFDPDVARWIWPMVIVGAGIAIIAAAVSGSRQRRRDAEDRPS